MGTTKQRGTRRLDARAQRRDYGSLPYNKGGPGGQAVAFLDTKIGRRDPPWAVGTERFRSLRLTLGLTIMFVEDDGRYRPQGQLRREMLRGRIRWIGATAHPRSGPGCLRRVFPPRFPFSWIGNYHVKIVPETRYRSHTYRGGCVWGGGGGSGSRGTAAIEPAP